MGKRQRKEEDRAGQAATATAKPHSDMRQTGAATEGGGGAARAAEGAEPTAKKKKKTRRLSRTGAWQRKTQKDKAAAAQGDRSQTDTQ